MRAIQMRDYGGNDVVHLAEVPLPDPGEGEIRIDVRAAVQVDDAKAVHEAADHVDDGRELHHRDRPHAGHDERDNG